MYELTRRFKFEAAHRLPHVPDGHKCARLHGHSYQATVHLRGDADPQLGWVIDFGEIDRICAPLREQLDHRCLNEIAGLENPTSEILARWIYERLIASLPALVAVSVAETCGGGVTWRP